MGGGRSYYPTLTFFTVSEEFLKEFVFSNLLDTYNILGEYKTLINMQIIVYDFHNIYIPWEGGYEIKACPVGSFNFKQVYVHI